MSGGRNPEVLNLRNPSTTTWVKLLPTVVKALNKHQNTSRQVEVVKPSVLSDRLQESMAAAIKNDNANMANVVKANPALKLLDFYRHSLWTTGITTLQPMSAELTVQSSSVLRDMPPIQRKWMLKWVDEWVVAVSSNI
ncbi:hypothetical protein O1611_g10397 [Lasiodiplodia mahajangana]|uniref:Uncharacterized protein n=1 Tax=Lasiodiplodia mahajangana TaxID=1108764 RepID=A0ACC2IYR2_9PEZI|nr:hypothetical protein O1611_g10397 [Lasiodiplodia mahajangana]